MTVFDQHIYWTDWNTRSIYRANKYDGSDQIVMIMNLPQRPMDIHVWAKSKQQQCMNPCNQFNGGCSHICAPGKLLCLMTVSYYCCLYLNLDYNNSSPMGTAEIFLNVHRFLISILFINIIKMIAI